jgi:hypothetical protein
MIRMMLVAGVCAAHLASAAAGAQSLYKCTDSQGRNSYQSAPCSGEQQQVWAQPLPDVRSPPASSRRAGGAPRAERAAVKRKSTRSPAATNATRKPAPARGGAAAISMHRDPGACESARERRQKTYQKQGLNRSFATSRKMDDMVHQACR